MNEKEQILKIQEACQSEGVNMLLEDIRKNLSASDTILVMPIIDPKTGFVISSTTDEMLKRQGYVQALNWINGLFDYYQNYDPDEIEDEI